MREKGNIILVSIIITLAMILAGCGKKEKEHVADGEDSPLNTEILTGTLIQVSDTSVLVLKEQKDGTFADLYIVGIHDVEILDEDKNIVSLDHLKTGMKVNVTYDGMILESYPGQIAASKLELVEQTGDIIGMYVNVLKNLYEEDPGLNSNIHTIALDFTQVSNLSEPEKEALSYLMQCNYNEKEIRFATIQQLEEEGAIKDLYYEDGIVFIISDQSASEDKFMFKAQKWRSGLGAIGYDDCTATKSDGVWEYKLSGSWIS